MTGFQCVLPFKMKIRTVATSNSDTKNGLIRPAVGREGGDRGPDPIFPKKVAVDAKPLLLPWPKRPIKLRPCCWRRQRHPVVEEADSPEDHDATVEVTSALEPTLAVRQGGGR